MELSSEKGKPFQKIVLLTAMMFAVFEASTTCWNLSVYVAVSFMVILSVLVLNAITECHRLGGLNSRYLFSTVLEARKSKIKLLTESECLVRRTHFQFIDGSLLAVSSHGRDSERSL